MAHICASSPILIPHITVHLTSNPGSLLPGPQPTLRMVFSFTIIPVAR